MKTSKNILEEVDTLIRPVISELGYSIWDIEYEKIGSDYHLVITIDKEDGIGIDDCEIVSKAIDPILDEADIISDEYHLDVSSPGIERNIRTDEHLAKCVGKTIQLKLFAPFDGKKVIVGNLVEYDDDTVIVSSEENIKVPRKLISKMNIYFEF